MSALGGLGSLGSIAGGFGSGLSSGIQDRLRLLAAQQARSDMQGQSTAGDALAGIGSTGGYPMPQNAQPPTANGAAPFAMGQGGIGSDAVAGGANSPQALRQFTAQTAQQLGIDPNVAVKVFGGESGFNPSAVGDGGSSFGVPQLHQGGVNAQFPHPGLGDEFKKQTGLDPRDPNNARAAIKWSLTHAKQSGWGDWSAAKNAGIGPWQGINVSAGGATAGPATGSPQGQAGMLGMVQQMALPDIVGLVKKAHPELQGQQLFSAVQQLQGVMNPDAQMQMRMLSDQIRLLQIQQQGQLGQERVDTSQRGQDLTHEDRQDRMAQQKSEFQQRMDTHNEEFNARIAEGEKKLAQTADLAGKREAAVELRSAIAAKLAADREAIAAAGAFIAPSEATKLRATAAKGAQDAQNRIDAAVSAKAEKNQPAGSVAPAQAAPQQSGQNELAKARAAIQQGVNPAWVKQEYQKKGGNPADLDK